MSFEIVAGNRAAGYGLQVAVGLPGALVSQAPRWRRGSVAREGCAKKGALT